MLLVAFEEKLKKLNPDLYVDTRVSKKMENGLRHCGIYLKANKRTISHELHNANKVHAKHQSYLEALATGQLDHFMGGVCIDNIPEFDIFNAEWTKVAAPGWRSIVLRIVKQKACTLEQARKVFAASLGEADYDKLNFFQKMAFIKAREGL